MERLSALPGVSIPADSAGPFVAVHRAGADAVRTALARQGIVLRSGTFPGLGPDWLRIAVRDRGATDRLVAAWSGV